MRSTPSILAKVLLAPVPSSGHRVWVSYQILDGIADGIVGNQAPDYVQSETAGLVAALVWTAIGAMLLKATSQTPTTRVA